MDTYSADLGLLASLSNLLDQFAAAGASEVLIKKLAANDNSKDQIYMAGDLQPLQHFPTGEGKSATVDSEKPNAKRKQRLLFPFPLVWLTPEGNKIPAPNAKLILYPQYPEVRLSGFLAGSRVRMSQWMSPDKNGRIGGRYLLLGKTSERSVLGWLVVPGSRVQHELDELDFEAMPKVGAFGVMPTSIGVSDRSGLIDKLTEIHQMGWVDSCKLERGIGGELVRGVYEAMNAGGYTLEALLGVLPNAEAGPDFLGWEVKQLTSTKCDNALASGKAATLMTPAPTGGIYRDQDFQVFMDRYGYPDKSGSPWRLNFGGIHTAAARCAKTGLQLEVREFEQDKGTFDLENGGVFLVDENYDVPALWDFPKLLEIWKRKHQQAIYIGSCKQRNEHGRLQFRYCGEALLCSGTDFNLFLAGVQHALVYYDPGVKLVRRPGERVERKERHQFRIKLRNVAELYRSSELVSLAG